MTAFKFIGRHTSPDGRDWYTWESILPLVGDSRHEQITCPVDWFWGRKS
jgi:hypothetical protein